MVGFTKTGDIPSFRLRNKQPKGKPAAIRVGENTPRSVTLPGIGPIKVHDDTRRLRRMLDKNRAKVLFATISRQGKTREPTFTPHRRPEPTTPEKGGAQHSPEAFDTL